MNWKWLLVAAIVPGGVLLWLAMGIWRVLTSEEFRREHARLRENRARRRAARRASK